jgi:uncharacterized damage-inducible protein DinB
MTETVNEGQVPERWSKATMRGMWLDPADDPRNVEETERTERNVLVEYLNHYRMTLELKCEGLSAEQMALRSVPPSTMSLLGLVRHMTEVERYWFRTVLAGEPEWRRYTSEDRGADFDEAVGESDAVEQAWVAWREEVAFAEQFVAAHDDFAIVGTMRDGDVVTLREVLVHMIEEYARHAGHADLLRECIDGRIGQ